MYAYRILVSDQGNFFPEYKRGKHSSLEAYQKRYRKGIKLIIEPLQFPAWEGAYKVLEQHATPAALAVKFVDTL